MVERRLGEDPLADLLDESVRLWVNRCSSRLRRKPARSPLGITFRTRGILITTVRSEPCMYSLKAYLATNISGVVLRACNKAKGEDRPNAHEQLCSYSDYDYDVLLVLHLRTYMNRAKIDIKLIVV